MVRLPTEQALEQQNSRSRDALFFAPQLHSSPYHNMRFSFSTLRLPFLLVMAVCFGYSCSRQEPVYKRNGITISFKTEPNMFPPEEIPPSWNPKATDLRESNYARSYKIIDKAMSKYPVGLLQSSLKKVYVVHALSMQGLQGGGTYTVYNVYVANRGREGGNTDEFVDEYVEAMFHHEFSSVLLRKNSTRFPHTEWLRINPRTFRYRSSGSEAIRKGLASLVLDDKLNRMGLLSQYSMASAEEDFNTIAAELFMGKSSFWNAVDRNKRLKDKVGLAIRFYHTLNPMFTEDYFRRIK